MGAFLYITICLVEFLDPFASNKFIGELHWDSLDPTTNYGHVTCLIMSIYFVIWIALLPRMEIRFVFFWPRRFNQENVMRSTHPKAITPNVFDLLDVFKVDSVSAISGGHFSWSYAKFVLRHWVTYLEMHLNSTLNIPDKCSTNLSYTNNLPKRSCHRVCRWLQKLSNGFSTHRLPRNANPLVQGTMKSAKSLPHFSSTAAVNSLVDLQMSRLGCALHANLVYSTMLMELERQSRQQKHNCK